ncbi:MAG: O-antigen ligase [Spartobacteria bacterium]
MSKSVSLLDRSTQILCAALVVMALWSIQALIGGTRLLFALPAYALLAIGGIISLLAWRAARPAPSRACFWSAAIFFGYMLVRAFLSPAPDLARLDIDAVLAGLVLYFLTACVLTSAKMRMSILSCLLAAALVHVLVGAIQFRSGNNFMPISFLQRYDYGQRASGFYVCPNHLAGLLEVLGIFGVSLVCWSRWPVWSKLLIGYAAGVCYLGVALTGSRGGYASVGASLLVFSLLSWRILRAAGSRVALRVGGAGLVVGVLMIAAAVLAVRSSDYLNDRTKKVGTDKSFRLDLWQAAIEQWKLSPILGTGSRTYLFYGRKFRTERMQLDPIYAHNDYLQLLAEYGAVGGAAFLIFFGVHWRNGWMNGARLGPKRIAVSHRLSSNAMAVNIGALSALGAYVMHSAVDFNLHIPANILLLAFVFGVLANAGVEHESPSTSQARRDFSWRGVLFIVAVTLGIQSWRAAPGEYFAEQARTALRDYRVLSAIDSAMKALEYEKRNPLIFYYLGRARVLGGDAQPSNEAAASFYRAAAPAFERARQLAPLDETYSLELAFTYDSLNRFAEAEWLYGEARAMDPRSTSATNYYTEHIRRWSDGMPILSP